MKALELRGKVESVRLCLEPEQTHSKRAQKIEVVVGHGVKHDRHAGPRLACVRESEMLKFGFLKGTYIANHREWSAISTEELFEIAKQLKLSHPDLIHGCLGENLIFSGIPQMSKLPSGSLLFFQKDAAVKRTAILAVWRENGPCEIPGQNIQGLFPSKENLANNFQKAAYGRRGIVGSVYSSGFIHEGDTVIVIVPAQEIYNPQ